ncbi:MAG: Rieske 2Fe-2S domain-containing protein [Kiloniellales bacterium]
MGWKYVCKADELQDRGLKQFEVEGVPILLARLGDDFFAYPPLCPHQEEVLAVSGVCDGSTLTCTKHLWQWDMRTGSEIGLAEKPLLMYQVRQDGNDVSVLIEQELKYDYDD